MFAASVAVPVYTPISVTFTAVAGDVSLNAFARVSKSKLKAPGSTDGATVTNPALFPTTNAI